MTDDTQRVMAKPFPRLWPSIGWGALYFALQLVIGIIAIVAVMVPLAAHDPAFAKHMPHDLKGMFAIPGFAYAVFVSVIIPAIIMLAIFWQVLKSDHRAEVIGLFAPSKLPLARTLGLGLALLALSWVLETLYTRYVYRMEDAQQLVHLLITSLPNTPFNFLLKLLTIVVAGPLVEEILFRGYLQNALKAKLPLHVAIVLTALIFGLYHVQLAALPMLTVVGLAIGYFYHYTGSLKWSMALHMLNNLVAFVFTLYGS